MSEEPNADLNVAQAAQVIVPPPEIKTIIDKLVKRVASQPQAQAQQFVDLILQNDPNNSKFNFLKNPSDPYRAYYNQRLLEERGSNAKQPSDVEIAQVEASLVKVMPKKEHENEFQKLLREEIFGQQQSHEIKAPPPDQFQFQSRPADLTAFDLDTIKLTAQFVVRNQSKQFLQKLTQQEARNPRFDFLKPTHPNFTFFTTLVEQYSRVMLPRSEMMQRYRQFASDPLSILKAGAQRQIYDEWCYANNQSEVAKQQANADKEMEEDDLEWENFVVVEKIDIYDDHEMKEMEEIDQNEKQQQALQIQSSIQKAIAQNQEFLSMPDPHALQQNDEVQSQLPVEGSALDPDMKIKQGYVRKANQDEQKTVGSQKCPNCKLDINKNEWREHFKICVLDSKWRDNKQSNIDRAGGMNQLASGDEISQNLKRLANQRPDLAGRPVATNEQINSATPTTSQVQNSVIWDGQSQNITRTTANIAMLRQQQQKNLQQVLQTRGELDQKSINFLKQQEDLTLQSNLLSKTQPQSMKLQPNTTTLVSEEDAGIASLQGQLRPESIWAQQVPQIQLTLTPDQATAQSVPNQTVTMIVESNLSVFQVKERLAWQLQMGIPPNMFVLRGTIRMVSLKDSQTLAFYNLAQQANLLFSIK